MAKINSQKENLKNRLGSDVSLPIEGSFSPISGVDLVIQDIQQLLLTIPGERPGRPEYGCALKTYIWENINSVITDAESAIENAIDQFEPRAIIIQVTSDVNENTGLIIFNILFQINGTDEQSNLVFPFRASTELL